MCTMTDLRMKSFERIEAGLAGSPEGRDFLREFERRSRVAGEAAVLRAVAELRADVGERLSGEDARERVAVLRAEIQEMAAAINRVRREIADIQPRQSSDSRITAATEELDAVVSATQNATSDILTSAERILDMIGKLREGGDAAELHSPIESEVMEIFTACSFQDLTGQRTTKVINVLRYIEQRIGSMISIWGVDNIRAEDVPREPADTRPDAHLLHGPSLDGIRQNEVDDLMAGLATAPPAVAAALGGSPDAPPAPARKSPPAAAAEPEEEEPPHPLNQSAIDALFG